MKLYITPRAPNPKRVCMFIAEKQIASIALVAVDINAHEHLSPGFLERNPLARVPVLALDDGRYLSESRAICTWLEAHYPEPNLMGRDGEERAFLEMLDRQVEWHILLPTGQWIRHVHPGLASLERPQFPDYGKRQEAARAPGLAWLEQRLGEGTWVAGERFSIADITAFCAIEFARLMKFKPGEAGYPNMQRWRDAMAQRPGATAGDTV